jgi:cytochrome oxidase assembly protein ShyY1
MSGSNLTFLLRPKWLAFHVLVIVSVALMVWLGFWQLRRLDARQQFNATVTERIDQPPVPFDTLLDDVVTDPGSVEWRQVTVSGDYLADQILWFNRTQDGIAGDNVLTALVGDDGTTVVVNRGFIALGEPTPPAPTGSIDVLGRIRVPPGRQLGELTDSADGPVTEVRRVDLALLDEQLPGELAPVYLDLIGSVPNVTPADPVPVPPPTLDEGPHLSYAVQWFIFAAAVLIGWVLAVRRSIATHRRRATADETAGAAGVHDADVTDLGAEVTDGADGRTRAGSPTSADAASTTTTH